MESKVNREKLLLILAVILAVLVFTAVFTSCNVQHEFYTNSGNRRELHPTDRPDTCKSRNLSKIYYHVKKNNAVAVRY